MIIDNWGHIITFWGRGFIGGNYHYLGARLLATFSLVVLDILQNFHCRLFSVFHQVLELLLAQFPILHGIVFQYLDYGRYRYGAI